MGDRILVPPPIPLSHSPSNAIALTFCCEQGMAIKFQWVTRRESFLLLLRICSIAVSTTCTCNNTIAYLRLLIEEKLADFKQLYPEFRIIPKFHYMVYYPLQIEMFGPLIHSWTMCQESKLSWASSDFKNVAITVAKKHQLWQCYKVHSERPYLHTAIESSPKKTVHELQVEAEHVRKEILTLWRPYIVFRYRFQCLCICDG